MWMPRRPHRCPGVPIAPPRVFALPRESRRLSRRLSWGMCGGDLTIGAILDGGFSQPLFNIHPLPTPPIPHYRREHPHNLALIINNHGRRMRATFAVVVECAVITSFHHFPNHHMIFRHNDGPATYAALTGVEYSGSCSSGIAMTRGRNRPLVSRCWVMSSPRSAPAAPSHPRPLGPSLRQKFLTSHPPR